MSEDDDKNKEYEEFIRKLKLSGSTRETLSGLTEREIELLRMRFGIEFNRDMTLEEVVKQQGITRQRIRDIARKALKKLGLDLNDDDPDDEGPEPA